MIAVTGGRGYIGRHVVRALEVAGAEVEVFDVTERRPYLRLLQMQPWPEAIVHLAAESDVASSDRVQALLRANVEDLMVLLTGLQRSYRGAFVFFSSSAVYAGTAAGLYGHTKTLGEALVREMLPWATVIRPFNVIGGKEPDTLWNGHLLPRLFAASRRGLPFTVTGSGQQLRYYVHMTAIVTAVQEALLRPGLTYDVRSDAAWTVNDVVDRFVAKHPLTVVQGARRRDDPPAIEPGGTADQSVVMGAADAFDWACADYQEAAWTA